MSTSPSDLRGERSAPLSVQAIYFDGRSAKSHAVTLTLTDSVLSVRGDTLQRDEVITTLRVSEPMGAASRLISFSDGAHCEVRDHAGMQNMLAASNFEDSWVVRVQNRWRWAAAAVGITAVVLFAGYR